MKPMAGGERQRRPARRAGADVAPGDEFGASRHAKCPPARRPHWLRLGRTRLDLARDRRPRLGTGGGARRARRRQGRPHPGAFQELRRDVLVDVCGLPARCGLGADQFPPDAGRGRLSRHRLGREGISVPWRVSRSCRRGKAASPALEFTWRIGEGTFGERSVGEAIAAHAGAKSRERCGRVRRSLLVLLHLGHHGPLQGGGADPRPDGLCGHQSSRRPDARHHRAGCLAGGGAAVAWRRRASARADRARRGDHPAADGKVRYRRSVPADRETSRQQHVHGADDPEDDGRASRGRPATIIPRCATSSMPARRCIARTRRRR